MAKKSTADDKELAAVAESLDGLDIAGLKDVIKKASQSIQEAKKRIESLDYNTRDKRITSFKKSDYYKSFKEKYSAIKAEIKTALKESSKSSFEAIISFSVNVRQSDDLEEAVYGGYDAFDFDVDVGKVTGDNLTKKQKARIAEAVGEYVDGMCEDGIEIFFPKLRMTFRTLEEKISDLGNELQKELEEINLHRRDIQ